MLCPICQRLIFLRVSTAAIRLPRFAEGEGVTQPMCHTTQVRRRQEDVVQIVTERGPMRGVSPRLTYRGGVTENLSQGVRETGSRGGVNRVCRM